MCVTLAHHVLLSIDHAVGGEHRSFQRAAPKHALQLAADAADPERLAAFGWVPAQTHTFYSRVRNQSEKNAETGNTANWKKKIYNLSISIRCLFKDLSRAYKVHPNSYTASKSRRCKSKHRHDGTRNAKHAEHPRRVKHAEQIRFLKHPQHTTHTHTA